MAGIILVTGATGFIGSHLCETLDTRGYSLRMAVRHQFDARSSLHPPGQVIEIDFLDEGAELKALMPDVDAVVHLAGRAHVMHENAATAESLYHAVNVEGTRRLAQAAAEAGVRRFIYISSVKAAGERGTLDQSTILSPEDAYGRSKLAAENVLIQIARHSNMSVIVLRPPLVYGHGVGANFLRLLRLVDRGIPLPFATINNRRSMIYVGNLVSAIVSCLESNTPKCGRYFVSEGPPISTSELIRSLADAFDRPSRLWPLPVSILQMLAAAFGMKTEMSRLVDSLQIDDAPFRSTFAWEPPFDAKTGLKKTVEWYRNRSL